MRQTSAGAGDDKVKHAVRTKAVQQAGRQAFCGGLLNAGSKLRGGQDNRRVKLRGDSIELAAGSRTRLEISLGHEARGPLHRVVGLVNSCDLNPEWNEPFGKLAIAAAGDQNSRSGSQTAGQIQLAHQRSREARVSRGVPRGVSFRCLIPGAEQDQNRFLSAR